MIEMDLRDDIIESACNSGESMKHLNREFTHREQTAEERIHHLDEARIRIMLCVSFTNLN